LRFFLAFGDLIGVTSTWTFKDYISFISVLMLVFGIAFQTPIAILILTRTGLVSLEALKKSRKYVFFSVFVVAAVVTPPDVISQISLAFPLYALFELGMILSYFSSRKRKKEVAVK
jgi:sec-independent protein translocase protein TatC